MTTMDNEQTGAAVGPPLERGVMPLVEQRATVAVLFARSDSVYKTLDGCEVYDMERDARTYDGPWPVVAHPPCRSWGRLRHMAKPRADERNLARLAVALVREFGGVLEHPAGSLLWPAQKLPEGDARDQWGGWTHVVAQSWWGHRAEKLTKLYIVGCGPSELPPMPFDMARPTHVITQGLRKGDEGWRPRVTNGEREHTPLELAQWLVDLARKCKGHNLNSGDTPAP